MAKRTITSLTRFLDEVSKITGIRPTAIINNCFDMLRDGLTVPFITRYRASQVGLLTADRVFELQKHFETYQHLEKARNAKLEKLTQRGLLTPLLQDAFAACTSLDMLEELWLPFKAEKKTTDFTIASSLPALCELAESIVQNHGKKQYGPLVLTTHNEYPDFVPQKGLMMLLTHAVTADTESRDIARVIIAQNLTIAADFKKTTTDDARSKSNFKNYANFDRRINQIADHQILALRRIKNESDEMNVKLVVSDGAVDEITRKLLNKYQIKLPRSSLHANETAYNEYEAKFAGGSNSARIPIVIDRDRLLGEIICHCVRKPILKSLISDVWKTSVRKAEESALGVFTKNLNKMLMTPPLSQTLPEAVSGQASLCGIDPGHSHGHKIVIIEGRSQKLLHRRVLYYNKNPDRATEELKQECVKYNVKLIAIGDGVGCFEAQDMAGKVVQTLGSDILGYCVVSEAGASVYSASETARVEYPSIEITYLGAISICQRLRDPMSELVKIPPISLGVGMYQRDLDEKLLDRGLKDVVEKCVNEVGVDVNTSSIHLLKYVAGLNDSRAKAILDAARTQGGFRSRAEIAAVKGIGPVTFRNAAGFLRIPSADNPLDMTCVHPDQYTTITRILQMIGFTKKHGKLMPAHIGSKLIRELFEDVSDWNSIAQTIGVDLSEVVDMIYWLSFNSPFSSSDELNLKGVTMHKFRRLCDIGQPSHLKTATVIAEEKLHENKGIEVGSVVFGTVRNIAAFGAFVDLGTQGRLAMKGLSGAAVEKMKTGLLHSSVVDLGGLTVGQRIQVIIREIDELRGRVSLAPFQGSSSTSIKSTESSGKRKCNDDYKDDRAKFKVKRLV